MSQGRDLLSRHCPNCGASSTGRAPAARSSAATAGTPSRRRRSSTRPRASSCPPERGAAGAGAPGRGALGAQHLLHALRRGVAGFLSVRGRSRAALVNLPSQIVASAVATSCGHRRGATDPRGRGERERRGLCRPDPHARRRLALHRRLRGHQARSGLEGGPLGTYSQAYQSTFASVLGRSVVVTDYRANLHVYDLATGHETRHAQADRFAPRASARRRPERRASGSR